ncbi:MAG TPA: ATP-binding cassette domain-containing protein [Candidatus Nitrosocosmicus sp.]
MMLKIVDLVKKFSGFTLGPLNLKISDNEILVMIGATGNGKTTILNLIAGLIKPDSGSIYLDEIDITNHPIESRNIGYSFQRPNLFPFLTVYQNIIFGIKKKDRINKKKQIETLVNSLGISHLVNRNIQGLSGGEMQKISLARTLVVDPKILLMDEPLSSLDNFTKRKLRIEIRQVIKNLMISCIYVTHFEEDVYSLADSVAVLKNGCIKEYEKLGTLLSYNSLSLNSSSYEVENKYNNYLEGIVVESVNGITKIKIHSFFIELIGNYRIGTLVGLILKPEDIILSLDMVKTSARNVIKTNILNIGKDDYPTIGVVNIYLLVNGIRLISRITDESLKYLDLKKGDYVFAIFKSTSPQIIRQVEV